MIKKSLHLILLFLILMVTGCNNDDEPTAPTATPKPTEFVMYGWEGDFPPEVLEAFGKENGVATRYVAYDSQEEALDSIRAGNTYDIVVLDNQLVHTATQENLLATLDFANIPNFRNISPNFRDLAYDPGNQHSIPYNWGTAGIVVRTDKVDQEITSWADLWDAEFVNKVALWGTSRYIVGVTLKSLGYSVNSEDPAEIQAAAEHLEALRPNLVTVITDPQTLTDLMSTGEVVIALGFAGDVTRLRDANIPIDYILPDEGAMLWGDNYGIPANSPNKELAERFLNYVLTPEVGAQIVNFNFYATPNEAAIPLADPTLTTDTVIFPPLADVQNGEIILPISPEALQIYDQIWAEFEAKLSIP